MGENKAPIRLILAVAAFILFVLGAAVWWVAAPDNRVHFRLMSAGLACWVLSTFF